MILLKNNISYISYEILEQEVFGGRLLHLSQHQHEKSIHNIFVCNTHTTHPYNVYANSLTPPPALTQRQTRHIV